jgi:site-specific DNA-methyltransferase (adenine-specific)
MCVSRNVTASRPKRLFNYDTLHQHQRQEKTWLQLMNDLVLSGATVLLGDCVERMKGLPAGSAQMCVTSPPYFGLRDYGVDGQLGLEQTPEQYVANMVEVFREVRRVLSDDGTLWLNIGDSYSVRSTYNVANSLHTTNGWKQAGASHKTACYEKTCGIPAKNMLGIPWRLALALQADGWMLRQDIIWRKTCAKPESVKDRFTSSHEHVFLLCKQARYLFQPLREDSGANKRDVWNIAPASYKGAHFAVFPPELAENCILAGSRPGDVVLDPFSGSGTTGQVALQHGRRYVGIELNPEYVELTRQRLAACFPAAPEPDLPAAAVVKANCGNAAHHQISPA